VLAFAREYGRPLPEVLMQAYGLTAEELGVAVSMDPARLSNDELVSEVARRLQAAEQDSDPADVSTSDRLKRRQAEGRERSRQHR
jgi:hypothetical protein